VRERKASLQAPGPQAASLDCARDALSNVEGQRRARYQSGRLQLELALYITMVLLVVLGVVAVLGVLMDRSVDR
jgi:hypothetical protein